MSAVLVISNADHVKIIYSVLGFPLATIYLSKYQEIQLFVSRFSGKIIDRVNPDIEKCIIAPFRVDFEMISKWEQSNRLPFDNIMLKIETIEVSLNMKDILFFASALKP